MSMKFLINLVECIVIEHAQQGVACILLNPLETGIEKLEALHQVYEDPILMYGVQKFASPPAPLLSFVTVEQLKPTDALSYILEPQEAKVMIRGGRQYLFIEVKC